MRRTIIIAIVYTLIIGAFWFVSKDGPLVQTAAIALTGLVIIWYAHETYLLRVETQKQTELQQKPLVLAQIKDDAFAVTNYGNGVAFNVTIKPIVVDEQEQIFIHFKGSLPILTSQETQALEAESFHKEVSAGEFFLAHLDPQYANQELVLEINYQNAELRRYCSREKISPQKRQILEFKVKET